jgi:hypothetical protein
MCSHVYFNSEENSSENTELRARQFASLCSPPCTFIGHSLAQCCKTVQYHTLLHDLVHYCNGALLCAVFHSIDIFVCVVTDMDGQCSKVMI